MDIVSVMNVVRDIASDLDVALEPKLCSVMHHNNKLQIVVTLNTVPRNEDEKTLMQSAFMCQIVNSFPDAVFQVHVPSPSQFVPPPVPVPSKSINVGAWIQGQVLGVQDWLQKATLTAADAAFRKVIDSYPWREKSLMQATVPILLSEIKTKVISGNSDFNSLGNVDRVLIPLKNFVTEADGKILMQEIIVYKKCIPTSLLEVYEAVYDMVVNGSQKPMATFVFQNVFCV